MFNVNNVEHEKTCTKCEEVKPLSAFWKSKKGAYGRRSICTLCVSNAYKDYRETRKASYSGNTVDSKVCSSCKKHKKASEFSPNPISSEGLRSSCKQCGAEKSYARRSRLRAQIGALKESKPCVDCNKYFPYWMMQFDHLDAEKKSFMVSSLRNEKELMKEIDKCEIICAGCHANRTYYRLKNMDTSIHSGSDAPYNYAQKWALELDL